MTKTRPQCGLILEDKNGRILLQLRDNKQGIDYPNKWGTFGGQIEEGETPEEAIKREIREELNYDLSAPEFIGNFPFEGYNIYIFRKIDSNITIKHLEINEGQKGEFLTFEQLRKLKFAFNCREIVKKYIRKFHKKDL